MERPHSKAVLAGQSEVSAALVDNFVGGKEAAIIATLVNDAWWSLTLRLEEHPEYTPALYKIVITAHDDPDDHGPLIPVL